MPAKSGMQLHWDDAVAAAELLQIASALVRDDAPFHEEIRVLCSCVLKALRVEWRGTAYYAAPTVMPAQRFREILASILQWDIDSIEDCCVAVAAESYKKAKGFDSSHRRHLHVRFNAKVARSRYRAGQRRV